MSIDQLGYGFGGFNQQPNPYGYLAGGFYPNYFGNNGGYYNSSPFGGANNGNNNHASGAAGSSNCPSPGLDCQQPKKESVGFFSRFRNIFSSDSSTNPNKHQNKILANMNNNTNPFNLDGSNFYNPYHHMGAPGMGHHDHLPFGKPGKKL